MRKYSLQPTRPDHPVKLRPFLHEIREELTKFAAPLLSDLTTIENLVLHRRSDPTPNPTPEPTPPTPAPTPAPPLVDMLPLLQAVRDQGTQGSCFAFAGTAIQALGEGVSANPPGVIQNVYAPADLSWNTRVLMGTQDQDSGGNLGDAIQSMESGTCIEPLMPYNQDVFATPPDTAAVSDSTNHPLKGKFYPIDISDPKNIDDALADGRPVYLGFSVWQGFESTGSDGIVPPPDGTDLGGHAQVFFSTTVVPDGTWPAQNSWGVGWGLAGREWFPKSGFSTLIEAYALVSTSG
jgi:hypothetical protein